MLTQPWLIFERSWPEGWMTRGPEGLTGEEAKWRHAPEAQQFLAEKKRKRGKKDKQP